MTSDGGLEEWVRGHLGYLSERIEGCHGLEVRREGNRLVLSLRYFADPNVYEIAGPIDADASGSGAWIDGLEEDLRFGFLARAVKARFGRVLRADVDGDQRSAELGGTFYTSTVLGDGRLVSRDGLNPSTGVEARAAGRDLGWWAVCANTDTGRPAVAQLVISRREIAGDAVIDELVVSPHVPALVGHYLVFHGIHRAAELGVHRLYSSRSGPVEPFAFAPADGGETVYDITERDLNWPVDLPTTMD